MATTRNTRSTHQTAKHSFGLLANGSSSTWDVAIDESTSGANRWFAQFDGPVVSFYFEIPSVDIVGKMLRFIEPRSATAKAPANGRAEKSCSLVIGKDKRLPVTLVRDDEYDDRFFLVVGPMDSPTVRFTIAGADAVKIADALRQIKEDLDDKD